MFGELNTFNVKQQPGRECCVSINSDLIRLWDGKPSETRDQTRAGPSPGSVQVMGEVSPSATSLTLRALPLTEPVSVGCIVRLCTSVSVVLL